MKLSFEELEKCGIKITEMIQHHTYSHVDVVINAANDIVMIARAKPERPDVILETSVVSVKKLCVQFLRWLEVSEQKYREVIEGSKQEPKPVKKPESLFCNPFFKKAPAMANLMVNDYPEPDQIRSCLLELARYMLTSE